MVGCLYNLCTYSISLIKYIFSDGFWPRPEKPGPRAEKFKEWPMYCTEQEINLFN